jgi:hypothetical protein
MTADCFYDHCIQEHNWGTFTCTNENCKFESYSPHCFKLHAHSHLYEQKDKLLEFMCDRKNCGKRFARRALLGTHLRIGSEIRFGSYCDFCLSGQNRQNLRIFSENPQKRKSKRTKPDFLKHLKKFQDFILRYFK